MRSSVLFVLLAVSISFVSCHTLEEIEAKEFLHQFDHTTEEAFLPAYYKSNPLLDKVIFEEVLDNDLIGISGLFRENIELHGFMHGFMDGFFTNFNQVSVNQEEIFTQEIADGDASFLGGEGRHPWI